MNRDGAISAADIDYLFDAIFGRRDADTFDDLTGDGVVDMLDMDHFLYTILGTTYGDHNLDGVVD